MYWYLFQNALSPIYGEHVQLYFSSQVLSNKTEIVADYLMDVAANPAFKPWEVKDVSRRIALDLANMDPSVRANELLHKAAYREGLGNSLYCPDYMVKNVRFKLNLSCSAIF